MVVTGSLAATPKLLIEMDPYTRDNSLFIVSVLKYHVPHEVVIPDIYTLIQPASSEPEAYTFPQFGYTCDQVSGACLSFQDPIDINGALAQLKDPDMESRLEEAHQFDTYRQCYRECNNQFVQKGKEFNFQVNTPSAPIKSLPQLSPKMLTSSIRSVSLPNVRSMTISDDKKPDRGEASDSRPTSTHIFRFADHRPKLPEGQLSPAFSPFSPDVPPIKRTESEPPPMTLPDAVMGQKMVVPVKLSPDEMKTEPSSAGGWTARLSKSNENEWETEPQFQRPKAYVPPHLRGSSSKDKPPEPEK